MPSVASDMYKEVQNNSQKWHDSGADKSALHDRNVDLYKDIDAQTGFTSTYDGTSGKWSTVDSSGNAVNLKDYFAQEDAERANRYSGGGSASGSSGGGSYPSATDLSDYLKEMYAQNIAAQLEALRGAYEQNAADLKANAEQIPETYQAARNETAAQNELERRAFNEYAAARGLNTGTSGQAALANSSVLQGNLAEISGLEADALAQNALEQERLSIAYRSAIAEAQASGNSALAQALYQEYVRQDQAAQAAAAAAQEQENWREQFEFSQQQYSDAMAGQNRDTAYNLAMTMLGAGVMPDSSTLSSAGISAIDAQAILNAYRTQGSGTTSGSRGSSSSGSSGGSQQLTLDRDSILALGRGPLSDEEVERLVEAGEVGAYEGPNGMIVLRNLKLPTGVSTNTAIPTLSQIYSQYR